jgi:hypothetical protein
MKRADQRKYHYIYKITRLDESGKYYIGMHSTDKVEDGYFGSGTLLSKSIKKHGKDKHSKEILEFLPTREALKCREKEIVNDELLGDKRCMNLKLGGEGNSSEDSRRIWAQPGARERISRAISEGWKSESKKKMSERIKTLWQSDDFKKKMSENNQPASQKARWKDGSHEKQSAILKSKWADPVYKESARKNISSATKAARAGKPNAWEGRSHSEESKKKMSIAALNRKKAPKPQEPKDEILSNQKEELLC